MRGRVVAVISAILLAAVGAVLLTGYVSGADKRALAGVEATSVLVVVEPIAKGTPVSQLGNRVSEEKYPAVAVADGALSSLDDVAGMVVTADLLPGEQLLAGRVAAPEELLLPGEVALPSGMQRVSLELDRERVVGGLISAGDTVGIFVSLDDPERTVVALNKVLVLRVQGATAEPTSESSATEAAPGSSVMVTLAVTESQALEVVFSAEHGDIWLTQQPADVSTGGSQVVTEEVIG